MKLPVIYKDIPYKERWKVRQEYVRLQKGLCHYCNEPLLGKPSQRVLGLSITKSLFPKGFFKHMVHLHHDHDTGLTIGAVHAKCNAVLWEYEGE